MNYIKKGVLWGLKYGIPIGLAIGFTFIVIFTGIYGTGFLSFFYLLKDYIVCVAVGFLSSALSAVWLVERWSLLKRTVLHLIFMLCVFIPGAIIGEWVSASLSSVFMLIGEFTAFYLLYWFAFYFYWKIKIKKLNAALKSRTYSNSAK